MTDILKFKIPLRTVKDGEKPYSGSGSVVLLYPHQHHDWSVAHECLISLMDEITDEQHHEMDVADICYVLESRIEEECRNPKDIEVLIEDFVELGELQHPYIEIARAYNALIEDRGGVGDTSLRVQHMSYIKPIANKTHIGRLAHYVLLLDAEQYGTGAHLRVRNALLDHGKDGLIHAKCQKIALGNEFLERLVKKYS